MSDFDEPLSPQGENRREQILQLTLRAARHRRQRPRILACAIATIAIVLTISIRLHLSDQPSTIPPQPSTPVASTTPPPSQVEIGRIETDPTISTRLALVPIAKHWQQIDDDELLQSLADAGQPAGIIEMNGQAILLTSTLPQP